MEFRKATKAGSFLRAALCGVSGSGKTYTALQLAGLIRPDARIAVVDTERGSASKYADLFEFDVIELQSYEAENYTRAIAAAAQAGYTCLVIDSLSHAWNGTGGMLEQVDNASARAKGNSYAAWRDVTPQQNRLIDAILQAPIDIIATMRSKTEYVVEKNERGKSTPRKVGMAPVQRDGMEYEFDVVADMDAATMLVTKSRCPALAGKAFQRPGDEVAALLRDWLGDKPAPAGRITPPPAELPELPATPPADNATMKTLWAEICTSRGLQPGIEARDLCAAHGAKDFGVLMHSQIWARLKEITA